MKEAAALAGALSPRTKLDGAVECSRTTDLLLTNQLLVADRQTVPVHLRAAHTTDGFSADQSILMQRHVPSRSGAICRYADGLVRAKIDAYGCDERVRRQRS
jgi:hypothetical protein